jgi:hypothetical protein
MQTREQNGPGANMKRTTTFFIDGKTLELARELSKAIEEVVDNYRAVLSEALAAVGYGAQEAETEPHDNPVRFIGIRKGGWKRGRGTRA